MEKLLDEKIELVKKELFKHHPGCHHTISILIWDDGTDSVKCQYGDGDNVYVAKYYDNELTYTIEPIFKHLYIGTKDGSNFYVVTEEQYEEIK